MSPTSARASGVSRSLRLDFTADRQSQATRLVGFPRDLLPQLVGQFLARTAVVPSQDQFAQLQEARLLLFFQRLQRLEHHRIGVRIPSAVDPVPDLLLGLGGQSDAHTMILLSAD